MFRGVQNIAEQIFRARVRFLATFLVVFILLFSGLAAIDLVPNRISPGVPSPVRPVSLGASVANAEVDRNPVPVRVVIDSVSIDAAVSNPESTDIAVLDSALQRGAVHYPGSGNLLDNSNLFLFGHSSHLPVVNNPAYRLFNNLEKVKIGETIRVQSKTHEYFYRVRSVSLVDAETALVSFALGKKSLTLSTCNSFGEKTERYVVEADFVGSYPLAN